MHNSEKTVLPVEGYGLRRHHPNIRDVRKLSYFTLTPSQWAGFSAIKLVVNGEKLDYCRMGCCLSNVVTVGV